MKRANRYYESREYQKATIEYLNALRLDPENPLCISRLGKVFFEQGQLNRAFPLLVKAQQVIPNDTEAKSMLLRIYRDAREIPKARELAADILGKDLANEEALLTLAESSVTAEETAEVEQRLEKLRSRSGDRSVFHVIAGLKSARQKDWRKAELALKEAVSLDPKSPYAHRALGTFFFLRGDIEAARQQYEQEVQLAPRDRFARLRFAEFKMMIGSSQEARSAFEAITKEAPDFIAAWSYLAALALEDKRYDDCASLVTRVLTQRPEDFRALLVQARLSMVKANLAQSINEFKKLRTFYGRVPQVHFELARAYLLTNDVGNALASLEQAVTLNPSFAEAMFLKGQIHLRTGAYTSAVSVFRDLTKQNPQMLPARLALAEAYGAQGALEGALDIYRNLAASFPTNSHFRFLMGMVYRQQDKPKEAEQAFAKAVELNPGHLAAWNEMLEIAINRADFQSARKIADQIMTESHGDARGWSTMAKLHLAQGDTTSAEAALLKTIELDPNSVAAYGLLASLYRASHRDAEALKKLDAALARTPNNLTALLQKAAILSSASNYVQAAESYEKIIAIAPQLTLALNNLAVLYSENLNKLDRAYEMASKAHKLIPDSPEAADTLGWILYRRGEYNQAVGPLSQAAAKLPNHPEVQFHMGMGHYMQGEEKQAKAFLQRALDLSKSFHGAEEARQRLAILEKDSTASDPQAMTRLQKLLEKQPDDPIGLMHLADLQTRSAAWDKARATYEQVLKFNPRLVQAILNLASLYAEKLNNPARALELAKQGRSLASNDPQIAHACGRLAFQSGDHPWAVGVLQETVQQQPARPDLLYDLAWALYSVGRVAEAQTHMGQALKLDPTFPSAAQAKQFLSMTELATNLAPPPQAVAAAQSLLKSEPSYVPALMVVGALETKQDNIKEARQTYERILGRYPQFSPALRALVILPEGSGNERQDYGLATKARKTFPDDAQVAKALGRALYKREEYASATTLLEQAIRSLREDAEAHYYLGMTYHKLGNKAQGRRDLQRALDLGLQSDLALPAAQLLMEAK